MSERLSYHELTEIEAWVNLNPTISMGEDVRRLIDEVKERRAREAAGPHTYSDLLAEIEQLKTALQAVKQHTWKINRAIDRVL